MSETKLNLQDMTTEQLECELQEWFEKEQLVDIKFDVVPGSDYRDLLISALCLVRDPVQGMDVSYQSI